MSLLEKRIQILNVKCPYYAHFNICIFCASTVTYLDALICILYYSNTKLLILQNVLKCFLSRCFTI